MAVKLLHFKFPVPSYIQVGIPGNDSMPQISLTKKPLTMNRNMLNGALCLALAVLYLTSCRKQAGSEPVTDKGVCASCQAEEAFPGVPGQEVVFHYGGEDITVMQKGDKYILGGDIILSPKQVALLQGGAQAGGRTAVNSITALWPNHTVYYTIDPGLPNAWRVTDAIAHWQSQTNLVFVQRSTEANYIYFFSDNGCYSSGLGMTGGLQTISLGTGCSTGNAIHEIGHAIGFYHEQTRSDRDNAITVNFGNITSGYENQFRKYTELGLGGLQLQGFDFNSVMLYGSYAFSSNGLPTIVRRGDNSTFEGQRVGLSAGDIDTYNYLYNRPYLVLVNQNTQIINTPQQRGRIWDVYAKAYTDASRTTPMNLQRDLEVHYVVSYQDNTTSTSTTGRFTFRQGTNSYHLGVGENLINLVGTKYTISQDYGLIDLIQ